jgi:hypothetical protein
MNESDQHVIYFDIGDTLGAAQVTPPPIRLAEISVFPHVPGVLQALQARPVRLGIISNTGHESADDMRRVLQAAGLIGFFEPALLIYSSVVGLRKDSPKIFKLAIERAGLTASPERCVFVGEDSQERVFARQAGMRVSPHPLLVESVLDEDHLFFAALDVPSQQRAEPWRRQLKLPRVVPLSGGSFAGKALYAMVAGRALPALANSLLDVQILGGRDLPLENDLFLLRDDMASQTGFMSAKGEAGRLLEQKCAADWYLASSESGILAALPGGSSVEEIHFEGARHGHHFKLTADPALLEPLETGAAAGGWLESAALLAAAPVALDSHEREVLATLDAEAMERHLHRYTGVTPLGDQPQQDPKIRSRHVHSADNGRATMQLARDLEQIGGGQFQVRLWPFTHEGQTLMNVEAELPGAAGAVEMVLITAHLDSTAAFSSHYNATRDPAPGADDDGSGVAAVLAIAERLKALADSQPARRTIRFVLFNAEEHGLVGSQTYARAQAAAGAQIVAVYQMDMIGFNRQAPRSFEVHAGFWSSADTQERSLALAQRLADTVPLVSPTLELPQVYRSTGPERSQRDPAEGRSDHAAFHQHGYAACVVSEDFFVGPTADAPVPEANPNYHMLTDTFVDTAYAADIARAVAAAAWISAR